MSLLDLSSEILVEVKGDVSDIKSKLKELQGAEKELAEQQLEAAESRNEGLESWVEKIGKVSLALVAVKEVGEIVWDGYKEGIHEAQLENAAMGVSIEGLGEAAHGLHTKLELLEFAAKANKSAFGATQEQMETAEKAMLALERRGVSQAEAQQVVTDAFVTGRTKGLEPYGIVVDKHIDKLQLLGEENLTLAQKTEIHGNALKALTKLSEGVVDGQDAEGESMQRFVVGLKDSWAEIKIQLGEMVKGLTPLVMMVADLVKQIKSLKDAMPDLPGGIGISDIPSFAMSPTQMGLKLMGHQAGQAGIGEALNKGLDQYIDNQLTIGKSESYDAWATDDKNVFDPKKFESEGDKLNEKFEKYLAEVKKKQDAAARKIFERNRDLANHVEKALTDDLLKSLEAESNRPYVEGGLALKDTQSSTLESGKDMDKLLAQAKSDLTKMSEQVKEGAAKDQKAHDKFLEKIFGPPSDFELYHKMFDTLSSAVGSMYDTIVSGQGSATDAFKKVIASSVEAIGKEMLIQSLKEGGLAVAALASYDYTGAAKHGQAAGLFAAGAVAAGVAAHELGYGGSGGGGSGGAPASMGAGGSTGGGGPTTQQRTATIVIGDSFAEESPRMRALKAQKLVDKALGGSGGKNS